MTDEQGSGKATPEEPTQPQSPTPEAAEAAKAAETEAAPKQRDKSLWLWALGIFALLAVELYVYGHNGEIEVCVGIEGVTNFAERNQPRTPGNFRTAPQCARRVNLGMYEGTEDHSQAALQEACSRATSQNRDAMPDCLRRDKKWTRQVYKKQIAPWDSRLYRRLLWID